MNRNLQALIKACEALGLAHESYHESGNLVGVDDRFLFVNWSTPLNDQSVARLCTDKDFSYALLKDKVVMPETSSYLSPFVSDAYRSYLKFDSIEKVVSDIAEKFSFPIIVKSNSGSHGVNVYRCDSQAELVSAVQSIFNVENKDYDYVLIAQQFIPCKSEFRAIWLNNNLEFAYDKGMSWSFKDKHCKAERSLNSQATLVKDKLLLKKIENFLAPLSKVPGLRFCGVDLVLTPEGQLYLIELNGSPGFDFFISTNGDQLVVELFKSMLEILCKA